MAARGVSFAPTDKQRGREGSSKGFDASAQIQSVGSAHSREARPENGIEPAHGEPSV